jgi:hypothetical protein
MRIVVIAVLACLATHTPAAAADLEANKLLLGRGVDACALGRAWSRAATECGKPERAAEVALTLQV